MAEPLSSDTWDRRANWPARLSVVYYSHSPTILCLEVRREIKKISSLLLTWATYYFWEITAGLVFDLQTHVHTHTQGRQVFVLEDIDKNTAIFSHHNIRQHVAFLCTSLFDGLSLIASFELNYAHRQPLCERKCILQIIILILYRGCIILRWISCTGIFE